MSRFTLFVLHDPLARGLWPRDLPPQFDPDLITFTPRLLSWDSQKPVAMTTCSKPRGWSSWDSMRWGAHHLTLLSWRWVAVKSAAVLFLGSLWRDWALARRERRGDPGLCVSAHPAAVTISAWRCLMPARPGRARPGSGCWDIAGPKPNTHLTSISPLWQEDVTKSNSSPRFLKCR